MVSYIIGGDVMANGYTSWESPGLGVTLYSFDHIFNPDWDTQNDFCPLVRPFGYNVMAPYEADIAAAKAAGQDFDTGELIIGYLFYNLSVSNYYFYIRIQYLYNGGVLGADRLRIILGQRTDGHYFYYRDYDYDNYTTWPEWRKMLYVTRLCRRDTRMEYASLPNYTGDYTFYVFFSGNAHIYTGRWFDDQPYGHMKYTDAGFGDPSSCLLSIPCARDNMQSRSEQSEGVFWCDFYTDVYMGNIPDYHITDANGNANLDPDAPQRPDPNENDPGGPSEPGGGDGDHRQPYTPIPVPGIPTIGPNSAGFVYMLRMDRTQMSQFALDLVRPSWWTVIKNFFADPLDFICGIMIVPYQPTSLQNVYPKFGDNIFDHAYPLVYQQYTEIDCGNLAVPKYFGSCFDNNPYTDLLVWLPYIGYRKLDPDECVGKTLNIKYHCDCLTGDCVCFISTVAGQGYDVSFSRVIAQYSGNCGVRVPFGAQSFDAAVAASISLLGGAVGALAGGVAGAVGLAGGSLGASQVANSISGSTVMAVNGSKTTAERSGTAGASAGYLSIQYPYLLRTVPNQSLPTNYQNLEGYPSNIAGPLTNFSGFAAVETINLNGIAASKEELDEIRSLLIGGVYI